MRVLVTGANGFVGLHLVRALLAAGRRVVAAAGPGGAAPPDLAAAEGVRWTSLDLDDRESVCRVARLGADAVVHLAGLASGREARLDPALAWEVNAAGTARLAEALGALTAAGDADPLVLIASTGEVYGSSERPLTETDPVRPGSPYAASKVGAELAALETSARTGLRVVVARAFPHTGPGQDTRFAIPAFAERLVAAKRVGSRVVKVGNLDVRRDLLDVRDVARAYAALLEHGAAGEVYNVASGNSVTMREVFQRLAALVGVDAIPEPDAGLVRAADLAALLGDASRLRSATGWSPKIGLDRTLRELVDAQTH